MFSDDYHIRHCGRFQGVMGEVWLLEAHGQGARALTSTEKCLNLSQARPFCGQHKGQNYAWVVGSSCPTVGGDQTRITSLSRSWPVQITPIPSAWPGLHCYRPTCQLDEHRLLQWEGDQS